jgi:hypothetical protein
VCFVGFFATIFVAPAAKAFKSVNEIHKFDYIFGEQSYKTIWQNLMYIQ